MRSQEKYAARVSKSAAEALRKRLKALDALDATYKPAHQEGFIYFPLKKIDDEVLKVLRDFNAKLDRFDFEKRIEKPRSLKDALRGKVPEHLLSLVPSSYDIVGEIILIEIPKELEEYSKLIGEELMKLHPRVKSVLAKGATIGAYRIREIRVIAGSDQTETIHREHGCVYKLDLKKAFFNPRFSGERLRVAEEVEPGEVILDMFAGVGPFSILIAKRKPTCRVTAVELNPDAYRYLVENIKLNKVDDRVTPILGDAREVARSVDGKFDRVIMDLPRSSLDFLDAGLHACKIGGMINLYVTENSVEAAIEKTLKKAEESGFKAEIEFSREVMEVAPGRYTIVLDLRRKA